MRAALRTFCVLAFLAAGAAAGPNDAAPPPAPVVVNLPKSAADALDAFRKIPWAERCKATRPDPAPDGWQQWVKTEAAFAALDAKDAPQLAALLADPDRFVRVVAARALGLMQNSSNAPALAAALAPEKDKLARVAMVEALGRCGGADALAAVEAQQTAGGDADVAFLVGLARRQIKGRPWDVANLRAEVAESSRAAFGAAEVGKEAPELGLPSPGLPVNLGPLKGKVVVLAFTHGDRDVVGEKALTRLSTEKERLERLDVQVIVVDPHEKERSAVWAQHLGIPFLTVASDPSERAASAYGVARQVLVGGEFLPSPAWFVIDRKGKIVWQKIGRSQQEHASLGDLMPVLERVSLSIVLDPKAPK